MGQKWFTIVPVAQADQPRETRDTARMILGNAGAIGALRERIQRLASFDTIGNPHVPTILLLGETGTGKGLVARVAHESGPRAAGPFIDVNCAAIPETMLEAELFGFEAGAFTDARRAKPGLFEAASGGTLFLDEIDSLSLTLQSKLLKAIEEKSIRRLGAIGAHRVDVKLMAATQANLRNLVATGGFRADLYHRLAVVVLEVPPLRARGEDMVSLAKHFLRSFADAHGLASRGLTDSAKAWLLDHPWPGNVRELSHLMERVTLLGPEGDVDRATLEELCDPMLAAPLRTPSAPSPSSVASGGGERGEALDDRDAGEAARVREALARSGGNVVGAARILGIGRNALRYRMRRLGIEKPTIEALGRGEEIIPPRARTSPPAASAAGVDDTSKPAATGWEQKLVATLAIDLVFAEPGEGDVRYDPWTQIKRWGLLVEEKVRGFGGVLLERRASRVTAAFGIPRALEQTPQRAVQAALSLRRLLSSLGPRPQLRTAVHLGEVRIEGDSLDSMLPVGDTLALPERLLGHAGAGEILVSSRVARRVAETCVLEPRELKLGPAREDQVTAYAVVAQRPRRAPSERPQERAESRFIGRDREIAILGEAFAGAAAAQGQLLLVVGEAGIGKSRLLAELRSRIADEPHFWVEGRCASYGSATPFLPIIDGLRRLFEIDDRDDEPSAVAKIERAVAALGDDLAWTLPYLRQVLSLPGADGADSSVATLDSASRRSETFRALRTLMLRAAEQRPMVLVVEDLHWIDPASEEYLAFVADVIPTLRVLLVCSHRPGYRQPFGDRSYHQRVSLRPLSEAEMADMTSSLLGAPELPPDLRSLIARKAEGNPFFVEEVTKSLLEDGSLARADGEVRLARNLADVSIPDTIQDVLVARIDRLADSARSAIQVASVIGREFAIRLLERISDVGEGIRTHLDELRSLELIYEKTLHPELAYMFKHALTHDVAYQSVLAERRKMLHRTIGLAIEELYAERIEEHYETLAHHFSRGEDWERALLYHDRAAEKAAANHANRAVVEHCHLGLAIAETLGDRVSAAARFELEHKLALAHFYLSEYALAGQAFERAAQWSDDPLTRSLQLGTAGLAHVWGHQYEKSNSAVQAALEVAVDNDVPAGEGMALIVRGFSHVVLSADLVGAKQLLDKGLERAEGHPYVEAMVRLNQSMLAEWTGDFARAIELGESVIAAGRELRLAHLVVWPTWFMGKAKCCLGDYGGAIADLDEAHQICDRIGDKAWKSRLANTLGWVLAEIGDHERARVCNEEAAELARQLGDPEIVSNAEINLSGNHLALGHPDEAIGYLEPIEAALARQSDPWMRWRYSLHALHARAQIDLAANRPEKALASADLELEGARRHSAPKLESRALTLRGRLLLKLERWDDAEEALADAVRVATGLGHPRAGWQAHGLLAELMRARGRAAEAAKHEEARTSLIERAASTLLDPDLKRRLLALAAEPA